MKKRLIYLFNLLLWSVYSFAQDTLTGVSEDPGSRGTGIDEDPGSKGTIPGEGSGGDEPINWLLYGGIALVVIVIIYFVMKSRKEK